MIPSTIQVVGDPQTLDARREADKACEGNTNSNAGKYSSRPLFPAIARQYRHRPRRHADQHESRCDSSAKTKRKPEFERNLSVPSPV